MEHPTKKNQLPTIVAFFLDLQVLLANKLLASLASNPSRHP
jgi:hypothetical protein